MSGGFVDVTSPKGKLRLRGAHGKVRKQQENRQGVGGWEQDSNQLVSIFLETNEICNVQGLQPNN